MTQSPKSRSMKFGAVPADGGKTRVFISYSRKDSNFATWLRSRLDAGGVEVFRDIEDTLAGEEWWRRLQGLISQADTIIFVLSPNSVASAVCRDEVAYALKLSKRVFPVVIADINWALAPDGLIKLHGLLFNEAEDREAVLKRLVEALETDIVWIREHTRLGELAQHWDRDERLPADLLWGRALEDAERWLTERPKTARSPTNLHQEYIRASRTAARRRLRVVVFGLIALVVLTSALGAAAYLQMRAAQANERKAELERSRVLTEFANENRRDGDSNTAALLSAAALPDQKEGLARPYYLPAEFSLRGSLREQREHLVVGGARYISRAAVFSPDEKLILTAVNDGVTRIWDAATGQLKAKLIGEKRIGARTVGYNPDHKHILIGDDGGNARIFDATSGALLKVFHASDQGLRVTVFDLRGRLILTSGLDDYAVLWDGETYERKFTLIGHKGIVGSAAFSRDGSRVVTASSDKTARVWDTATGREVSILQGHNDKVEMAVFSPDGHWVLTASDDKTVWIWDTETGRPLNVLSGHEARVLFADFSPDGRHVITASADKTARIWELQQDTAEGKTFKTLLGHTNVVHLAAFSADAKRVVTISDDLSARVWEVNSGVQIATLRGHQSMMTSAVFSRDGKRILTASEDGSARVWDVEPIPWIARLEHKAAVVSGSFSMDGRFLLTASEDHTARIWNALDGVPVSTLDGHAAGVTLAAFSPKGTEVVTASHNEKVRIWSTATGKEVRRLDITGDATSIVYSADGRRILIASDKGEATLWDSETGVRIGEFKADGAKVFSAKFGPNELQIITCSANRTARLWDSERGKLVAVLSGHTGECRNAEFSSDGSLILTAGDVTARLWDGATGQPIKVINMGAAVSSAVFDAEGRRMLVVSAGKPFLHIWDITSGKAIELRGHDNPVTKASFSPDGRQVVSVSNDGSLRLWASESGGVLEELRAHESQVLDVSFSPDGEHIVTASRDQTARLWATFGSTQGLLEFAKSRLPRCLTDEQRNSRFGLGDREPTWCADKWPKMQD
jgi:WD40 repeat protein